MLSTQHLKHLEEICKRFEREGVRFGVRITTDELRQLIAAARVANAAAQVDRERNDGNRPDRWSRGEFFPGHALRNAAEWQFSRALARYTQPQPRKANA